MFQKGQDVKICFTSGQSRTELAAKIDEVTPLKLRLLEGRADAVPAGESGKQLIDVMDCYLGETLLTAEVLRVHPDNILEIRRLTRESRQFVRVSAFLDLSYEVIDPLADLEDELQEQVDAGEPLPEMTRQEMKTLARTEEASEAVLYLLRAVQSIDRRLDSIYDMTRQLLEQTAPHPMVRRRVVLSGSGLRFETDQGCDVGVRMALRFRLPLARTAVVKTVAETMRVDAIVDPEAKAPRYGIACKFVQIRATDRERIVSFAIRKQREALRRMRVAADGF
ncbi:MAG: hypothetical protein C4523_10205 [Myxococcales bacterium]|nr:MAG: hypothetical protein C4523_10205 [Myxococcales bacterium]